MQFLKLLEPQKKKKRKKRNSGDFGSKKIVNHWANTIVPLVAVLKTTRSRFKFLNATMNYINQANIRIQEKYECKHFLICKSDFIRN